jgi:hypothetical protein
MTPEKFTLHVPNEVLDDLRVRLERSRLDAMQVLYC